MKEVNNLWNDFFCYLHLLLHVITTVCYTPLPMMHKLLGAVIWKNFIFYPFNQVLKVLSMFSFDYNNVHVDIASVRGESGSPMMPSLDYVVDRVIHWNLISQLPLRWLMKCELQYCHVAIKSFVILNSVLITVSKFWIMWCIALMWHWYQVQENPSE